VPDQQLRPHWVNNDPRDRDRRESADSPLNEWGASQSPNAETVELNGYHTKSATFAMAPDGSSFELTYLWENGDDATAVTVRKTIKLYRSPRKRHGKIAGFEVMFLCPCCSGRAKRLALLRYGVGCAMCAEIRWGSERESKIARLVRRIDEIAGALELQDWYEVPRAKPKGMRVARYLSLIERSRRLVAQLDGHFARRRRLRGNNRKYLHETILALQRSARSS
jgi:hypothetical protein